MSGWTGVDLDGTLAEYHGFKGPNHIGEPIPKMVNLVKKWISEGREVKIFTARVHGHMTPNFTDGGLIDTITPIKRWVRKHIGADLEITNVKDFGMVELWDDRAVQVKFNTGERVGDEPTSSI